MSAPRDHRLVIHLRFGRTRGASFAGDPRAVLLGLGMVLVCVLCTVLLVLPAKHQLMDRSGTFIMQRVTGGTNHAK